MSDASSIYRHIGARVREARKRAGVRQADLGKHLGMTRTSVTNIESGLQRSPVHVYYKIAERLGVSLSSLMPDEVDREETT